MDSIELLGNLAQKRRQEVQEESVRPQPSFLESIDRSMTMYYFRRRVLPLAQLDTDNFLAFVKGNYGCILDSPDRSQLRNKVSTEELLSLSDEEILQRILVQTDSKAFSLSGGKFPLKMKTDFVPILSISVNFEYIAAEVAGITQVATTIVEEIFQLLSAAAGSDKRADDAAELRIVARYGTATRVALPFPAEHLMSDELNGFIRNRLLDGEKLAARTRPLTRKNNFSPADVSAVVTFDDLTLTAHTQDKQTGHGESHDLRFSVTARSDHGAGNILVSSTMNYDDHIRLLELLIDDLGGNDS